MSKLRCGCETIRKLDKWIPNLRYGREQMIEHAPPSYNRATCTFSIGLSIAKFTCRKPTMYLDDGSTAVGGDLGLIEVQKL